MSRMRSLGICVKVIVLYGLYVIGVDFFYIHGYKIPE